ncbi:hypothetical protein BH10BAC2_BH10BAC2_05920 [soil metagenome]
MKINAFNAALQEDFFDTGFRLYGIVCCVTHLYVQAYIGQRNPLVKLHCLNFINFAALINSAVKRSKKI